MLTEEQTWVQTNPFRGHSSFTEAAGTACDVGGRAELALLEEEWGALCRGILPH